MKHRLKTRLFLFLALLAGVVSATTVTFDAQGGDAPTPSTTITVTNGVAYGPLATTTRDNYTFGGWWTEADDGGMQITATSLVTIATNHTLYAKWTGDSYLVTYNAQGGSDPIPVTNSVTYGAAYGTLATTSRDGYDFSGWWIQAGGVDPVIASTPVSTTHNHTLYAKWTAKMYTVSFDANGGDVANPVSKNVTYGVAYGALAMTQRAGYTFKGWWTDANGGAEVTASTKLATAENHTLYAKWEANSYTVSYDAQGGTAPDPVTTNIVYGADYGELAVTTRTGYTFEGWWTDVDGGTHVTASTKLSTAENHTLYANWTANIYTVTFDANGGVAIDPATTNVVYDAVYGDLVATSRTGYDFGGWWTEADGGTQVTAETPVSATEDHTLYAKWTGKSSTVTFDPQGGTELSPVTKNVTFGDDYGTLATTTRPGYVFAGWWVQSDGDETEVTPDMKVSTDDNQTFYAKWTAAMYTVTFDVQEGDAPSLETIEVTHDAAYGTLATTTREGYTFEGWMTEAGGSGTEVTALTVVSDTQNHTLYAQWAGISYTVTFDPQGGIAPDPASTNVTFGAPYGTLATTTRDNYSFSGWWTEVDGQGMEVTAATEVTTVGAHNLYANWTTNSYVVSFDAHGGTNPDPETIDVTYGQPYGVLATTTRDGYTFDGWWVEAPDMWTKVSIETVLLTAEDHTLHAKWTANEYTVTFNAQGGSDLDPASKEVVFDANYGELPPTTRTNYVFGGWWTEAGGQGTKVMDTTMVATADDHTLYAKWTGNSFAVTFDVEEGVDLDPDMIDVIYDAVYGELPTTTRAGYAFGGWWTEADGQGMEVTAETMVTTASAHTLYASWSSLLVPVYRFWSPVYRGHFYTKDENEKNNLIENLSRDWAYEGVAYHALAALVDGTQPVYRFWSARYRGHFYTISESEKDNIVQNLSRDWAYEGIAYYAYPTIVAESKPVYRFWSSRYHRHFYTISESEMNSVVANLSHDWNFEGIAFYAFDSDSDPDGWAASFSSSKMTFSEASETEALEDAVCSSEVSETGLGEVIFPLTVAGGAVNAFVFDPATEEWTSVVNDSQTEAVFADVQPGREYGFEAWSDDSSGSDAVALHTSSFVWQLDAPEVLDSSVAFSEADGIVGAPVARLKVPATDGTLTLKLYSATEGVVEIREHVLGGETVEFDLPGWNCWYWVSGWCDADNALLMSIWIRNHTGE